MATLIVAGASLSRQGLADIYRERAQNELATRPASALTDANRSLDIDSDAVEAYYVKAGALARFDQAAAAVAALHQALAHEPNNFVTWALLGDIAVRERRLRVAGHDYTRATNSTRAMPHWRNCHAIQAPRCVRSWLHCGRLEKAALDIT